MPAMDNKKKPLLIALAAVDVTLKILAIRDLRRRTPDQVRGPKPLWFGLQAVNFIGPLTYFTFGRR